MYLVNLLTKHLHLLPFLLINYNPKYLSTFKIFHSSQSSRPDLWNLKKRTDFRSPYIKWMHITFKLRLMLFIYTSTYTYYILVYLLNYTRIQYQYILYSPEYCILHIASKGHNSDLRPSRFFARSWSLSDRGSGDYTQVVYR